MDLEQITRDIFRIPVLESHDVTVQIDSRSFTVVNLGSKGLGIILTGENLFAADNKLHAITLVLGGKQFNLEGRVVHVSPHDSGNYLCGIELVDMDVDSSKAIDDYIRQNRSTLFAKER
ncbi:MAG: PilZ domain-containing protein [Desulfobulbaceae bacterium]|nr:PilZ domain-containing protein [Desulfobulbaceae bacterium]